MKQVSLLITTISIGMYIFLANDVPSMVMYPFYALLAFTIVYGLQALLKNSNRAANGEMAQA